MNHIVTRAVAGLAAATFIAGCGSAPTESGKEEAVLLTTAQELNALECTADMTECVASARNISGLIGCNEGYAQCLAGSVEEVLTELPKAVIDAVGGSAQCTNDLQSCVQAASAPSDLLVCEEEQVACLADVLNIPLPAVPLSGAAVCAESAADCVLDATTVGELTQCAQALTQCTTDAAVDIIDDVPLVGGPVGDAIGGTQTCVNELLTCTQNAQTPSELVACQEAQVLCLADAVGVELPDPFAAVDCATDTVECVLDARSLGEIGACAEGLAACGGGVIEDVVGALPLPGELGDAVDGLTSCTVDLQACVVAADSPSDLLACEDANADCVGATLGVDLPSGADAFACADSATECVFDAGSLSDLTACTEGLTRCAVDLAPTTGVPFVDCSVQFTQCVALNPFGLFQCAEESRICHANNP